VMPEPDGLEASRRLSQQPPEASILMIRHWPFAPIGA
jgi:CheY-like chemotaxis protein